MTFGYSFSYIAEVYMCPCTVLLSYKPTDRMAGTLGKGKACLSCRARKSVSGLGHPPAVLTLCILVQKCDGIRPSCGRCSANQRPCEYRERSKKEDVLETQVNGLTDRLRILEMRRVKPSSPALSIGIDDIPARWWEADDPPEIVSRAL